MFKRRFPNGFKSWQKTHYHVVQYITAFMAKTDKDGILLDIYKSKGQEGLYETALEWTWKYEDMNRYRKIEPEVKKNEIRNYCDVINFPW